MQVQAFRRRSGPINTHVVAALPQLHRKVVNTRPIQRPLLVSVQELQVLLIKSAVILLLQDSELHLNQSLLLGRDTLFHIFLQATQDVRSNGLVELVHLLLAFDVAVLVHEPVEVVERVRVDEV